MLPKCTDCLTAHKAKEKERKWLVVLRQKSLKHERKLSNQLPTDVLWMVYRIGRTSSTTRKENKTILHVKHQTWPGGGTVGCTGTSGTAAAVGGGGGSDEVLRLKIFL